MTPESHGDDYYYHLLLLYYRWRQETQDLLGDHTTVQEALLAKSDQLQFLNSEHNAFAEELQQAIQQLSEMQNIYGDNVYAPVAPNAVQHTLEVKAESAGFDPIYDTEENVKLVESDDPQEVSAQDYSGIQAALLDDRDNNLLSRLRMTDHEHQEKVSSLNDTQRMAFDHVVQYTCACHQYFMREKDTLPEPLHLFITGGACTSKSHVISLIKEHTERAHTGFQNACMLMGLTGQGRI